MKTPYIFTTSEQIAPKLSIKPNERKNGMRNKKSKSGWVMGLAQKESTYQINGVTYIVSSAFEPRKDEVHTLRSRFERLIRNTSADLTTTTEDDIITAEYVSAAHPNSDRKEQNAEENSSETT